MNISSIVNCLPTFAKRHKVINLLITLFPDSRMQIIPFNDSARLVGDLTDCAVRQALIHRSFEPEFFGIAYPFLHKGGTFFDVGANFGFCTYGLINKLQEERVHYHLFEASPDYVNLLNQSAALYKDEDIHVQAGCVTDSKGLSYLVHEAGSSECAYTSKHGTLQVENVVLDTYIDTHCITKIDFLKMDIEGFEPLALAGASRALTTSLIDALYFEVSSEALARNGFHPEDCFQLLTDYNYQLFYCKTDDFEKGYADDKQSFHASINGCYLKLCPFKDTLPHYQTDILALSNEFVSNHLIHNGVEQKNTCTEAK